MVRNVLRRRPRKRGVGVGVMIAAIVTLIAYAPAHPQVVNRIVATIDGEPVTLFELEHFTEQVRQRDPAGGAAPGGQRAMLDELILDKIVKKQIAVQGVTASERQIDSYIASIRDRNQLTDDQLKKALADQGLTWEQYREKVRDDIERAALIGKEIRDRVNVSPEEVERYYKAHLDQYAASARVRVRLISLLVPAGATPEQQAEVRAEAERIRELAAAGKDFAKLAKEHSQGPSAAEGGDLGEISRGQMQVEFEEQAFALKRGEVSRVVETDTGYHILKVEKHFGDSYRPLEEVNEEIRDKLYREAVEERYERWIKQDLRSRHNVEILL